jgi:hypothetical protein
MPQVYARDDHPDLTTLGFDPVIMMISSDDVPPERFKVNDRLLSECLLSCMHPG